MKKIARVMVLVFLSTLALLPVAYGASSVQAAYEALDLFGDAFERIRTNYHGQVVETELIQAAIEGMMSSLDPGSRLLRANEPASGAGAVAAVGIDVSSEFTFAKVVSVTAGAPAAAAGITPGDYIAAIDGRSIQGLSPEAVVAMLRGPDGSRITLTVLRRGEEKPLEVALSRAIVRSASVEYRPMTHVGYIRVASFAQDTGSLVERAVADLKRDIGVEIKGYILDLRNNSGGLLDEVVAVADIFLVDGELFSTRGQVRSENRTYRARRGDVADGKPVVVLINEQTAAGAEIVAGALQHHRRATVLGTKSRGHGSVQTIIPIGMPRRGALRLTTAHHYLPSGRAVEPDGIEPDIAVSQAAALSGSSTGPQYETLLPCCFPVWSTPSRIGQTTAPPPGSSFDDFQLSRALEQFGGP